MKIEKFNSYIKESLKVDYMDYFQILIDKYGEDIEFKDADGFVTITLMFVNSQDNNIDTVINGLTETIEFFKDIRYIRSTMDLDKLDYDFYTKDFKTCSFSIDPLSRKLVDRFKLYIPMKKYVDFDDLRLYRRIVDYQNSGKESIYNWGNECDFRASNLNTPNTSMLIKFTDQSVIENCLDCLLKSKLNDFFIFNIIEVKIMNEVQKVIEFKPKDRNENK